MDLQIVRRMRGGKLAAQAARGPLAPAEPAVPVISGVWVTPAKLGLLGVSLQILRIGAAGRGVHTDSYASDQSWLVSGCTSRAVVRGPAPRMARFDHRLAVGHRSGRDRAGPGRLRTFRRPRVPLRRDARHRRPKPRIRLSV